MGGPPWPPSSRDIIQPLRRGGHGGPPVQALTVATLASRIRSPARTLALHHIITRARTPRHPPLDSLDGNCSRICSRSARSSHDRLELFDRLLVTNATEYFDYFLPDLFAA